jgi:DNA-binding CsgD family transcriptional regulator
MLARYCARSFAFRLDETTMGRILVEAKGNPLALLELPRGLSSTQLAGGFRLLAAQAVPARVEESFRRRLEVLPGDTRRLLLLAAADPVGDAALVWRAAERLEIETSAAVAAEADGLVEIGTRVQFRHPLVRSAVYRSASLQERQATHRALGEVTDRELDPDRRAWHLAAAAPGADDEVASELERSAGRARARGGVAAAAAFLQRSVELTRDPAQRAERALATAQAHLQAGSFDSALEMLTLAESGALDQLGRAQVHLLRGQIAFTSSFGPEAPALLLKAARELESLDVALARQTYLDAWAAAMFAGRFARAGTLHEVSRAATAAPQPTSAPRPSDLLLDGLAILVTEGRAAAASSLKRAARVFGEAEIAMKEGLRWGWGTIAAIELWDWENWHQRHVRQLQAVREAGLLVQGPVNLHSLGTTATWRGEFATAGSLIAEADAIADATGTRFPRYAAVILAAFRGKEAEASALIDVEAKNASAAGQGMGVQWCQWTSGILYNGLGRYEEALAGARDASEQAPELYVSGWALAELIEAAARTGETRLAGEALERLVEATSIGDSDWGLGVLARSRALVTAGQDAEGSYREAIVRLSRTPLRPELARAQLVYGEWLRREGRRVDARAQLRAAHDQLASIGMEAFAERSRRELSATGGTARNRTPETRDELTPQEAQIADLARAGLSNPEIAAQLFLSPHTVEYHLRKVFAKLEISSRHHLQAALADRANAAPAA